MAASIFSLYGEIFIDNEKANKSIDEIKNKGENTGKSFAEKFGSIAKTTVKVGTAVVGAATTIVGGLSAMATNVADTAGAIDDSAKKVGASAEEYQKWTYAAKLGGMETSKLDALMVKQQKAFSDAKEGSTSLTEAYKRLGIDIKNVGSSGDAFNLVIDKLADMEDITTRNALANDIFGKSYADLAPLLAEGSDGIAKWKQEAVDLGGIISDENIEAGASFGDLIDQVKTAFSGMFNNITSQLFPILSEFLNLILDNLPLIQDIVSTLAPILIDALSSILPPFLQLTKTILPILVQLINQLMPFITTLIKTLLPVIIQLIDLILPPLLQLIELILPLLINLIEPLLPLLEPILKLLQPFIDLLVEILSPLIQLINLILPPIITLLTKIFENVLPSLQNRLTIVSSVLSGVFGGTLQTIKEQISLVIDNFKNIIYFVKNVFTGNWTEAWENIKKIFKNIATGIGNSFKAPLNVIIDGINGFLKGLKKIKIPDWVPLVGGKGFNVQLLNRLRVGMDYVPYDEMLAILHKGETVLNKEDAEEYRNNKDKSQSEVKNIVYNNNIVVEKMEVREDTDIERIAEELLFLQKKEVGA